MEWRGGMERWNGEMENEYYIYWIENMEGLSGFVDFLVHFLNYFIIGWMDNWIKNGWMIDCKINF